MRPRPAGAVMRQASWRFQGRFHERRVQPAPISRRSVARAPENAQENIVAPAIGRYIARANPLAGPGPAALPNGIAQRRCDDTPAPSASCCRPRRVAAPGDADRMNRAGVFADTTPTEEFRDVMVPNAPGLKTISLFPHNIASPAGRSAAALAARLGVLPQCRSACLSMLPTPRKSG